MTGSRQTAARLGGESSVSQSVDGGPEDRPVARGTSGGGGPKKRTNGGAGSDGSTPEEPERPGAVN